MMRRTLLTTTALAMTVGTATAEIAVTGSAEMGIAGSDSESTRFHSDIDVTFSMSGETDGGLIYEAAVDLDENDAFDPDTHGGVDMSVSGPFGTFTLGDTDGAFDWALAETDDGSGGSLRDDHTTHLGFSANSGTDGVYDGQILRYDTSLTPGVELAFSAEFDDEIDDDVGHGDAALGIGARYTVGRGDGNVDLALGYQVGMIDLDHGSAHSTKLEGKVKGAILGASLRYKADTNISVVLNWSRQKYDVGETLTIVRDDSSDLTDNGHLYAASDNRIGLGLNFTTGPVTIGANWGRRSGKAMLTETVSGGSIGPPLEADLQHFGYGVSVAYSLGGGAAVQFGYGDSMDEWSLGDTLPQQIASNSWSLGLAFSF